MNFFQSLLILILAAVSAAAALSVRVQPTPGGPMIHVNGKPIPPRFFFGVPRGGACAVGQTWTQQAFDFTPSAEVKAAGTLHFRFGQMPGEIWLADVRIVDVETGAGALTPGSFSSTQTFAKVWNLWPPGEKNTVGEVAVNNGALRVALKNPPGGVWPDFHLHSQLNLNFSANRKYRVTFRARATPSRQVLSGVYQVSNGEYLSIGGPPGPFFNQVALAREMRA